MSTPTLKHNPVNSGSRIVALGSFRPENLVSNEDICQWIDSSDEWIRQRTGIITRMRADKDTSVVDMAEHAARNALNKAGMSAEDLDVIIVSTVTHPFATPSAATKLSAQLGALGIPAFDISAACAGYCYGIAQADALIRSGMASNVLVVGAEKLSDFINNYERTISFLLGDGAGAAIVSASKDTGIAPSVWGSDGSKYEAIGMNRSMLDVRQLSENIGQIKNDPAQQGLKLDEALMEPISQEQPLWPTLRQDGQSVFRWAVWEMAKAAQQALEQAGVSAADLAAFVPHQANMRIIDELAKQLKLPDSVLIARDIADAGNTSAASIPVAMDRLTTENPQISGGLALQIGFGAGLVFAAQVVVLP